MYCRNLIYLTYGNIWLILYTVWGFGIICFQVFGHLRSFKGWIQNEACVIPNYHGMLIRNRETNRGIIKRSRCSIQAKMICSTQAKA